VGFFRAFVAQHMLLMLKPGGYLINFGPLTYHFEDSNDGPSVELTWAEVRHAMVALGFVIVVGRQHLFLTCNY
jgi:hypothetical protein